MAYGALEIKEYSPISSVTDNGASATRRQPSWAEGLSPLSTDNNHSWIGEEEEEEIEDYLNSICVKSVPAKLLTNETDHVLQIQICWACRLDLSQSSQDKKLTRIADENPALLKIPHFAVSSWDDVANIIHSDNGVEATDMIFWVKQQSFAKAALAKYGDDTPSTSGASTVSTCSTFDSLCSSSAEDYAKATEVNSSVIFPVEEACLRCRRTSLLPVILDEFPETRHAVRSAILFKESALKARAVGSQAKKYNNQTAVSVPSTPFTTSATGLKRHVTESPPDGGRRQVVNLFNAIGLNNQNWKYHLKRAAEGPPNVHHYLPSTMRVNYNRWSPTSAGSTDYSSAGPSAAAAGSASVSSPPQRRRSGRKNGGRRKMSSQQIL